MTNLGSRDNKRARRGIACFLMLVLSLTLFSCGEDEKKKKSDAFDYDNCNYDEYMLLPESVFTNQTVSVPYTQSITDAEFDEEIEKILLKNGEINKVTDRAAEEGDTVLIYFRGVTESNGKEVAFDGGTYMDFGTPQPLTIGSGGFISGFEDGLIGVVPMDTYRFEEDATHTITKESVVRIDYVATYEENGSTKTETKTDVLINCADCDYGESFVDLIQGMRVNEEKNFDYEFDIDGDKTKENVSMTVLIDDVLVLEACEVEATFPQTYPDAPSLAGKTVKFYVWVEAIQEKIPAVLDETFIKETLKFSTTESDVIGAYKKALREEMQKYRDDTVKNLIIQEAWDDLFEGAVFYKLPQSEVDSYKESLRTSMEYEMKYYQYYGYSFESLEAFVIAYTGVTDVENFDLDKYFEDEAEEAVKRYFIFKYICKFYDMKIDKEILKTEVDEFLKEQASSYGSSYTPEKVREEIEKQSGEGYIEGYIEKSLLTEKFYEQMWKNYTPQFKNQ